MFSILISEKGGAERREQYDRTEINVGRVQGNELMLPKGNVSKRHAKLLYREGRFIVTDLKSTNGTYVNGRKIAQATLVRESDKIYIGDFVLRVEGDPASAEGLPQPRPSRPSVAGAEKMDLSASQPSFVSSEYESLEEGGSSPSGEHAVPPTPPGVVSPTATPIMRVAASAAPPSGAGYGQPSRGGRGESSIPGREVISHFPLEHDPDEDSVAVVPGPPRIPSEGEADALRARSSAAHSMSAGSRTTYPDPIAVAGPPRSTSPSPGMGRPSVAPSAIPISPPRKSVPSSDRAISSAVPTEPEVVAAKRAALRSLVERATKALNDPIPLIPDTHFAQRVNDAVHLHAGLMKADASVPDRIDVLQLVEDARRELLGAGLIDALLELPTVSEIRVVGHDHITFRQGGRSHTSDIGFTSEEALARTLDRLCLRAERPIEPGEAYVERSLPAGVHLVAIMPQASGGRPGLVLRKTRRATLSVDELVRNGAISRAIAVLLQQCVASHANILIAGSLGSGTTSLLGALASVCSPHEHVIALLETDELSLSHNGAQLVFLGHDAEDRALAVRTSVMMRPDRLIVGSLTGAVAAEVIDAVGDGLEGVLAATHAPTLRQAAQRLSAGLCAARPGLSWDAARESFASTFDLAIEVARLRDGRHRVMRIAEPAFEGGALVLRDIFTFAIERTAAGGAVEGSFYATGVIPRAVEDLATKGVAVDTSLFKRS